MLGACVCARFRRGSRALLCSFLLPSVVHAWPLPSHRLTAIPAPPHRLIASPASPPFPPPRASLRFVSSRISSFFSGFATVFILRPPLRLSVAPAICDSRCTTHDSDSQLVYLFRSPPLFSPPSLGLVFALVLDLMLSALMLRRTVLCRGTARGCAWLMMFTFTIFPSPSKYLPRHPTLDRAE